MDLQQAMLDGVAQIVLALEAIDDAAVHALVEQYAAGATSSLGVVHRDVGVAQQL